MSEPRLVIIADQFVHADRSFTEHHSNLDMTEKWQLDDLLNAVNKLDNQLVLYGSPAELEKNLSRHLGDVVLPNWFGAGSRNRTSLIPAICEANNVRYIGGDPYTRIICHDKALAKSFASRLGLRTPQWVVIESLADMDILDSLSVPFVLKPNRENSSMGIKSENLIYEMSKAREVATRLLDSFEGPVIAEGFAPGREVSICMVGDRRGVIDFMAAAERFLVDDEKYLFNHLFDLDLKKNKTRSSTLRSVTKMIEEQDLSLCRKLFKALGKVEILRVDGRLAPDGRFSTIELTPNPLLTASSEFIGSFICDGFSYEMIIEQMIKNALKN